MTDINLDLALSKSQISDLVNALEDHRDDFLRKAVEAQNGFGLDPEYWESPGRRNRRDIADRAIRYQDEHRPGLAF